MISINYLFSILPYKIVVEKSIISCSLVSVLILKLRLVNQY